MPRKRDPSAPPTVHRTARCGLRVTRAQRGRLFGLLRSAGDVWCCVLELNRWRRQRRDPPLAGYRELCQELAAAGPGTFGELDSAGARSVLRRYSDAWFAAAELTHRRAGAHLPGVHPARRDPRRRPPARPPAHGPLAGTGPPRTATTNRGVARHPSEESASRRPTPTTYG